MISRLTQLATRRRAASSGNHVLPPAMQQWWATLTARERRLLGLAAGTTLVALVWVFGLKPALETIEKQGQALPRLRSQAAEIDGLILQAKNLQRQRAGNIDASDIPVALRDSLTRSGLAPTDVRVTALVIEGAKEAPKWEIVIDSARADVLMKWLSAIPALLTVHVESLDLQRGQQNGRDRPGEVNGRIVLGITKEATP